MNYRGAYTMAYAKGAEVNHMTCKKKSNQLEQLHFLYAPSRHAQFAFIDRLCSRCVWASEAPIADFGRLHSFHPMTDTDAAHALLRHVRLVLSGSVAYAVRGSGWTFMLVLSRR